MKKEFLALDADGDGDVSTAELEFLFKTMSVKLQLSGKDIQEVNMASTGFD